MKLSILKRYHDLATAGHQGVRRTKAKLKEHYYWPQMDQDIAKYVATCISCQRNADRNSNLPGLLQPLPIPTDRFRDISIDFATIPPHPEGWNQLMVVVCRLTKLVRLIPCRDTDRTDKTYYWMVFMWIWPSSINNVRQRHQIHIRTLERYSKRIRDRPSNINIKTPTNQWTSRNRYKNLQAHSSEIFPTSQTRGVGNKPGVTGVCT
jgi:hypothetical protein